MLKNNFGGVIWTNHALARLEQRHFRQSDVIAVWRNPDKSTYNKTQGSWTFLRNMGGQEIGVVAKKNGKNGWIILSVWSKN